MNKINMILAITLNYVIGFKEKGPNGRFLPWKKMSTDIKRFSALSTNHIVVMGRKTWETLPKNFRPLPDRDNWVLTRDPNYTISEPGVLVFNSVFDILQRAKLHPDKKLWIIGGAEIYEQFQKHVNELHITHVQCSPGLDGNGTENLVIFTPNFHDFEKVSEQSVPADENNEVDSIYVVYRRKKPLGSSMEKIGC